MGSWEKGWLDHYKLNTCKCCGAVQTEPEDSLKRGIMINPSGLSDGTHWSPCPLCCPVEAVASVMSTDRQSAETAKKYVARAKEQYA